MSKLVYSSFFSAVIGLLIFTFTPIGENIFVPQAYQSRATENSPEDQLRFFPGIIGTDDRIILESDTTPFTSIGRVNIAGYAKRSACTGVLVGPNMVLTATSCLKDRRTGRQFLAQQIHFVANQTRDTAEDHAKAACIRFMDNPDEDTRTKSTTIRTDIALILLEKNLSPTPATITALDTRYTKTNASLSHPHYARERPFLLSADMDCSLRSKNKTHWLTDCDTNFGGAGGPILIKNKDNYELAAIMVGVIPGQHSIAIPAHHWQSLLKITSCDMR